MGNEHKWLLKEGMEVSSESWDISLENMHTSLIVSLALFIYHAVILQHLFCMHLLIRNNSKWCLPSFVSCSSCTVLLLRCLLLIFEGRPIFGDYHSCLQKAFCQSISSFKSALECMMTVIFYCGERHYHVL